MTVAALLLAVASVGYAAHTTRQLQFLGNLRTTARLPAATAETTYWYDCHLGRVQSLYWQMWVKPGSADSVRLKIDRQWRVSRDTTYVVSASDTVISLSTSNVTDTTGAPRGAQRQFWPILCWEERFIVTALSGTSDSGYVGNLALNLDDLLP